MSGATDSEIRRWLRGSGDGSGSGYGYGDCDGSGDGDGYGYGDGSGDGYGYGYGDGSGDGDCDGYCSGSGDGSGSGYGYGYGYGDCDGSGDGDGREGVAVFCGRRIWRLDGVPTLINGIVMGVAHGEILRADLTTERCYVARRGRHLAHGRTVREAVRAASDKALRDIPLDERVARFRAEHPDPARKYPGRDLFRWHNLLTGSCEQGRLTFCRDRGLDPDRDSMTVWEFCALTRNAFGEEAIKQLEQAYHTAKQ